MVLSSVLGPVYGLFVNKSPSWGHGAACIEGVIPGKCRSSQSHSKPWPFWSSKEKPQIFTKSLPLGGPLTPYSHLFGGQWIKPLLSHLILTAVNTGTSGLHRFPSEHAKVRIRAKMREEFICGFLELLCGFILIIFLFCDPGCLEIQKHCLLIPQD